MKDSIRLDSLGTISDNRLIRQLESLRGRERIIAAGTLRHLSEVERRRLYLPRGYSSLFEFCTEHLKYSRPAAGGRIAAARALSRFPVLEKHLVSGSINLHTLSTISKILTEDNIGEIIKRVKNRPTREIEAVAAHYRPQGCLQDRVRTVCIMKPEIERHDRAGGAHEHSAGAGKHPSPPSAGSEKFPGPDREKTSGGSAERVRISRKYRLEFAVDPAFMEKLERMKALLSPKYPGGISFEKLFMILMDDYMERHSPEGRIARRERRRASRSSKNRRENARQRGRTGRSAGGEMSGRADSEGGTDKKGRSGSAGRSAGRDRSGQGGEHSRHIPQRVRDEVFIRDKGRCTFIGSDGRRCNSNWNIQIDHIVPFALGGDNSPGNLRLLCGKHNRLEAERIYGRFIAGRSRRRRSDSPGNPARTPGRKPKSGE